MGINNICTNKCKISISIKRINKLISKISKNTTYTHFSHNKMSNNQFPV